MKYKSIIEKADDFSAVLMTENGYPVYDIMVPSTQNYCSASGMAFYTEDDKLLKEFSSLDTQERKAYLIANPQYVKNIIEIFKESPEMNHPMPLAYNHLLPDFENTVNRADQRGAGRGSSLRPAACAGALRRHWRAGAPGGEWISG